MFLFVVFLHWFGPCNTSFSSSGAKLSWASRFWGVRCNVVACAHHVTPLLLLLGSARHVTQPLCFCRLHRSNTVSNTMSNGSSQNTSSFCQLHCRCFQSSDGISAALKTSRAAALMLAWMKAVSPGLFMQ
jgi:hypothetical protein